MLFSPENRKQILWLLIFSISMGFLESAVVIYLRDIYYPDGFNFPLTPLHTEHILTEILREAATIFMLFSIAVIAGKTLYERFAWFLFCFAIWDIFYYIFLKVMINWPPSLLTWDILFLIPVTWVGPVITPMINALTMIVLALLLIRIEEKYKAYITPKEWFVLISGAVITIFAYTLDYIKFLIRETKTIRIDELTGEKIVEFSNKYIPASFPWFIYIIGEIVILLSMYLIYRRYFNKTMT